MRRAAMVWPLVWDDPAWQLLFDIVWKGKPVGPVPIGVLYVDHEFEGMIDRGAYTLAPGYYWLKVDNDRRVIAEDSGGDSAIVGYASFGGFTAIQPRRAVRYFLCLHGAHCNNIQQNNPPQGGGSGQEGGGGG